MNNQQIRLHALNIAVASRQAVGLDHHLPKSKFADAVLEDAAKYEAFLRGQDAEVRVSAEERSDEASNAQVGALPDRQEG